jgi:hypothetical protein
MRRASAPMLKHPPAKHGAQKPRHPAPPWVLPPPVQQQLGIYPAKAVVFKFVAAIPGGSSPARGTAGGIHALIRLSPVLATHFLPGTIFSQRIISAVPALRGSLRPPPAPYPRTPRIKVPVLTKGGGGL